MRIAANHALEASIDQHEALYQSLLLTSLNKGQHSIPANAARRKSNSIPPMQPSWLEQKENGFKTR